MWFLRHSSVKVAPPKARETRATRQTASSRRREARILRIPNGFGSTGVTGVTGVTGAFFLDVCDSSSYWIDHDRPGIYQTNQRILNMEM